MKPNKRNFLGQCRKHNVPVCARYKKDSHKTQVSASVSKTIKARLEKFVRARGLRRDVVIERALDHYLPALPDIPENFFIPPTVVVTPEYFNKLVRQLKSPAAPTPALRSLMQGEFISEEGLY